MNIKDFLRYTLALLAFCFMAFCFYLRYVELGPKKIKKRTFAPPSYVKVRSIVFSKDNRLGVKLRKLFVPIISYPKNAFSIKEGDFVKITGYINRNYQLHVFTVVYVNLWPRRIKIGVSILALWYVLIYVFFALEKKWPLSWK